MSFTYDITRDSDLDAVRILTGDVKSPGYLSDEEIAWAVKHEQANAAISGDALRYYAAARCLEMLQVQWSGKGLSEGIIAKRVADLSINLGLQADALKAITDKIASLRSRGSFLLRGGARNRSRVIKAM